MRRTSAAACAAACAIAQVSLLFSSAAAQPVSEDIHELADGPSKLCGITANDAPALLASVRRDPRVRAEVIESERFELYASSDHRTQFVATLPGEPAHPAISCRQLSQDEEGNLHLTREMRCDASRAACDALFREFQELDERVRAELSG
jgi:hypothetical protein